MCQAPFSVLLGPGGTVMNKVDKASTPKLILLRLGQRVCCTVWLEARQCKNGDALESPGIQSMYV